MTRVIYDCHSHTFLCGHAEMIAPRAFHAVANAQNFKGYAYCCHNPFLLNDVTPEYRMPFQDFKIFLSTYKKEKEYSQMHFPELDITLNMEVDYHPADPTKTKQFVDLCTDFDCLLGSLHYYEELFHVQPQDRVRFITETVVPTWKQAVSTGWFNVMSHYDFFKARFGPQWYLENYDEFGAVLDSGLVHLSEFNKERELNGLQPVAIECNTGGLQYGSDPFLPTFALLEKAIELNIPIVMSSDAHYGAEVGRCFKDALTFLKSSGLQQVGYYKKKVLKTYNIDDALRSLTEIDTKQVLEDFKLKNKQVTNVSKLYQ